jgi:hypothetical protein
MMTAAFDTTSVSLSPPASAAVASNESPPMEPRTLTSRFANASAPAALTL